MTIASELTKLNTNLTNSYTAVSDKGGTLPQAQNFDNLATAISSIPSSSPVIENLSVTPTTSSQTITASGGVDGYSPITVNAVDNTIDSNIIAGNIKSGVNILGVTGSYEGSGGGSGGYSGLPNYQVVNGVASQISITLTGNEFSNITSIGQNGLRYAFYKCGELGGLLKLPSLTTVSSNGLSYAFYECTGLTSVSFPALTNVADFGLNYAFYNCFGLTSVNLSALTTVQTSGLSYAFYGCSELTSVDLSALTTVQTSGLSYAFYGCSELTSVDLSSVTSIGSSGLYYAFAYCTELTSIDLSSLTTVDASGLKDAIIGCERLTSVSFPALTSIGTDGLYYAFSGCESLTSVFFPALNSENITNNSFPSMLSGCTDVTVHFPFELESTMSSWSNVTRGFSGTRTTVIFDLNGCELTFAITPTTGNRLIVNGDELSSNTYLVRKNSTVSYEVYNSSYGLYISEYSAPDADSATVTADMTALTYNTISLDTGVSGLTVTVTIDSISYPLTETGTTGVYTFNIYKTVSGSVSVNYFINGGSSYMDENGTLTFNNSDISETITLTPAQDISFTRPNLTANGTMGGDSFAVKSGTTYSAYRAVDSSSTNYVSMYDSPYTFEFYNPEALKVSQLDFNFPSINYAITGVTIEGSNDDTNWTQVSSWEDTAVTSLTVDVNSPTYYKYYKLTMTPYGSSIRIRDLGITAVYKG